MSLISLFHSNYRQLRTCCFNFSWWYMIPYFQTVMVRLSLLEAVPCNVKLALPNLDFWGSILHRMQNFFASFVRRFRGPSEGHRSTYSRVNF
ncbi:hypothetical protein WN943_018175 [Citrus x changshan-huyou]